MNNKKIVLGIAKTLLLVIIAYISFKQAYPITNSLVHIEPGPELMISISILFFGPIWVIVYITIGVIITSVSWSILVHFLDGYLLAKEVKQEKQNLNSAFKKKSFSSYMLQAVGGTLVIVSLVVSFFVLFAAYQGSKIAGESHLLSAPLMSFNKRHSVKIHEDKRVSFYMNELQSSTQKFVNADVNYNIFKYDVHMKMAVYCLQKIYWDIEGRLSFDPQKIQENILNDYVAGNSLERQASNNYFYARNKLPFSYDGYGAGKLDKKYPNRCENFMTVEEMYQLRIPSYLIEIKELPNRFKSPKRQEILGLIKMIQENFKSTKN